MYESALDVVQNNGSEIATVNDNLVLLAEMQLVLIGGGIGNVTIA